MHYGEHGAERREREKREGRLHSPFAPHASIHWAIWGDVIKKRGRSDPRRLRKSRALCTMGSMYYGDCHIYMYIYIYIYIYMYIYIYIYIGVGLRERG